MTSVLICWTVTPRREWNECMPLEDQVHSVGHEFVLYGSATIGAGDEPVAFVYGALCCIGEANAYIDAVLGPAMNAQLDEAVGPRRWKGEATDRSRRMSA